MNKVETNVVKPEVNFTENDIDFNILSVDFESKLDDKLVEIEEYMKTDGKGKTEEEKDEMYKNAQALWKEFILILTDTKYNFFMNRHQYKFLTDLLITKMEYDVNTIFYAIELTDLMGNMKELSKYGNDEDLIPFPVDATEITYIYHLISKYKVKGLGKSSYLFAQVLTRIGLISKIFNYYDVAGKNLATEIQDWVFTFEEGVVFEPAEVAEAIVVEAKSE